MAAKGFMPKTRYQKGRTLAMVMLALTTLGSMWANVRSGSLDPESIGVSVWPPIIFFGTVALLHYKSPKSTAMRIIVWAGLGLVALIAFGVSGYHITMLVIEHGQPWYIAVCYPIITDIPTAVATGILLGRDVATQKDEKGTQEAIPTVPVKAAPKPRTTTKPPVKAATATKATKPVVNVP